MNHGARSHWLVLIALALALGCIGTSAEPVTAPDETVPEALRDPVELAHRQLAAGEVDRALATVEAALASAPEDAELWYAKGVVLRQLGRSDEALHAWTRALEFRDALAPAWLAIGGVELERGELESAIEHLQAALERDPGLAEAHHNLGLALLGRGDRQGALAALQRAHQLAPTDVVTLSLLAEVTLMAEGDKQAEALVTKAASLAPDDPSVARVQGLLLFERRDYAEAVDQLQRYLDEHPSDVGAHGEWARAAIAAGRAAQVTTRFAELAARDPGRAEVWLWWGTALGAQGRHAQALAKFDKALELSPRWPTAHVRRLAALAALGRCSELTRASQALAELEPGDAALTAARRARERCRRK